MNELPVVCIVLVCALLGDECAFEMLASRDKERSESGKISQDRIGDWQRFVEILVEVFVGGAWSGIRWLRSSA